MKEIVRFILNISICYLVAYGVAKPLVERVLYEAAKNVKENVAMVVGMVLFVGLNYLGQRYFVFKQEGD